MMRGILGAIAAVLVGGLVILLIEMLGHACYPFPPGVDPRNHDSLGAYMKTAPLGAWMFVLAAYYVGSFAGGAVGAWIGCRPWAGWAAGAVLMTLGLVNLLMMPHPAWFWAASLAGYLPAAWAGARLARRSPPAAPALHS
jgi:hypothetical protein